MAEQVFNLSNALDQLGRDLTQALVQELKAGNKVASGDLAKSFTFKYVVNDQGVGNIQIIADDYAQDVNDGRKPGSTPPIEPIKRWMEIKGIPKKALYPILNKIKEKGIKPYPYIDKVLAAKQNEIKQILERATVADIEAYLKGI